MPTKNPRVMVTVEPSLHKWLKKQADEQGVSVSNLVRDLIRDACRDNEDYLWAQKGEERLQTYDRRKALSHHAAWKDQ